MIISNNRNDTKRQRVEYRRTYVPTLGVTTEHVLGPDVFKHACTHCAGIGTFSLEETVLAPQLQYKRVKYMRLSYNNCADH